MAKYYIRVVVALDHEVYEKIDSITKKQGYKNVQKYLRFIIDKEILEDKLKMEGIIR